MVKEKQTLAAMEEHFRKGPPWLMMVFVAMIALLAMFFILNAQMIEARDASSGAAGMDRQSTLEGNQAEDISSFQ